MFRAPLVFVLCLAFAGLPATADACTTVCAIARHAERATADPVCHGPASHHAAFGTAPHACGHDHHDSALTAPAAGIAPRAGAVAWAAVWPALPFVQPAQVVLRHALVTASPPGRAAVLTSSQLRI